MASENKRRPFVKSTNNRIFTGVIGGIIENHPRLYFLRLVVVAYYFILAGFLYTETIRIRSSIMDRPGVIILISMFVIYFVLSLILPWDPRETTFGVINRKRVDKVLIKRLITFCIAFFIAFLFIFITVKDIPIEDL